jgi:hypothetical protein
MEEVVADTEYDVAVSFAGENREYVDQVVERLQDEGVRVFYDENEQANLWGRNLLEELVETYRSRAFRVLMFVSKPYAEKAWPTQERRAALERAMQSTDQPYVLPVLLDDTQVPGMPSTTHYVDGRRRTAVEVADLTIEHLRRYGRDVGPPPAQRDMAQRVSVRAIPGKTPDGRWEVPYTIHNGTDYPINTVLLAIKDPGQEGQVEDQIGTALELVIGNMASGETVEGRLTDHVHFSREPAFAELTYLAAVLFTDHWGNNWAATGRELVRKKHPARVC